MVLALIGLAALGTAVWHGSLALAAIGTVLIATGAALDFLR